MSVGGQVDRGVCAVDGRAVHLEGPRTQPLSFGFVPEGHFGQLARGIPARTGLGSLSATGNALHDPRPGLVPAQPGKTADSGLGATLHLGNPSLSVAGLDLGLQPCQKFRVDTRALAFENLEASLSPSSAVVAMTEVYRRSSAIEEGSASRRPRAGPIGGRT